VTDAELTGLDRWVLGEFSRLEREVIESYDHYEFHVVYQKISQFVAVELSAIYHVVIKDRLYTDPANSPRRRSTQTALHKLVTGLCRMLAPILAFTADEAWEFIPGKTEASVHQTDWHPLDFQVEPEEQAVWKTLFASRATILPDLEKARQEKRIGKALEAKAALTEGKAGTLSVHRQHAAALRELLNVSQLEVLPPGQHAGEGWTAVVTKADGQKCERCWHWEADVGSHPDHPTLCSRCVEAVER
jgi:isoleucyl-tRNA synthetase